MKSGDKNDARVGKKYQSGWVCRGNAWEYFTLNTCKCMSNNTIYTLFDIGMTFAMYIRRGGANGKPIIIWSSY
jgi:hypothetical protein